THSEEQSYEGDTEYERIYIREYGRAGSVCFCFFFNDPATTEIYTLSLHDALPISGLRVGRGVARVPERLAVELVRAGLGREVDRSEEHTSNSSHVAISYAVFCLKKKTVVAARQHEAQRRGPGQEEGDDGRGLVDSQ